MTAKPRILVVEDDPSSRAALVALLRLTGYEATQAATVSEGLRQLHHTPSVVILDLMLPDGNGGEILQFIRGRRLPIDVVITTGSIDWRGMIGYPQVQPDVVLNKPVDFAKLTAWLRARSDASSTC